MNKAIDKPLGSGGVTTLDADLKAGSYTLYCPILNHRKNGEQIILIIKPASEPVAPTSTGL